MSRVSTRQNGARDLARDLARMPKLMNRARNEAARGMRTDATRYLTQRYTLPAKRARASIRVKKAMGQNGRAGVEIQSGAMPLSYYRHLPRQITSRMKRPPKGGAAVQVTRQRGRVRLPHVFKARMSTGHEGLFRRGIKRAYYPGAPRLPIYEHFGPTPPKIMTRAAAVEYMRRRIKDRVHRTLDRHINYAKHRGRL